VLGVVMLAERGLLPRAGRWGDAVRIHATNGFYVEAIARRLGCSGAELVRRAVLHLAPMP
jgi:hypothetical protein